MQSQSFSHRDFSPSPQAVARKSGIARRSGISRRRGTARSRGNPGVVLWCGVRMIRFYTDWTIAVGRGVGYAAWGAMMMYATRDRLVVLGVVVCA